MHTDKHGLKGKVKNRITRRITEDEVCSFFFFICVHPSVVPFRLCTSLTLARFGAVPLQAGRGCSESVGDIFAGGQKLEVRRGYSREQM